MLPEKTVFILGAGFSYEVGMPLGVGLKGQIATALKNYLGRNPDQVLSRAIAAGPHPERATDSAQALIKALPGAVSIDNLIEHRSDDRSLVHVGKVAIAYSILKAEASTCIRVKPADALIQKSWIADATDSGLFTLFQILMPGVPRAQVSAAMKNVAFINFNYDRCLEHFLFSAFKDYSGWSDDEAAAAVNQIKIWHPYGVVGRLPWQTDDGRPVVPFGLMQPDSQLLRIAEQIRTFSEETRLTNELMTMRNELAGAQKLIFLGLAFNAQNMRLLRPVTPIRARAIGGTCFKLPPGGGDPVQFAAPDVEIFTDEMISWMPGTKTILKVNGLDPGFQVLTCNQFLAKYDNYLRRVVPDPDERDV